MDPNAKKPHSNSFAEIAGLLGARGAAAPGAGGLQQAGLLGLETLFNKPEVRNVYYNGKLVVLDGYSFIGCRFDNCRLRVSSVNFELIDCVVDASTQVEYGPDIAKPIRLFSSAYSWADQFFPPYFRPKRNPNGTITVSEAAER